MEIKKRIVIILIFFIIMACNQKTFTLDELKGNYQEVKPSGKLNPQCTLTIRDSTLEVSGCRLSKSYTATKIRVRGQKLWHYVPEYGYNSIFDIKKKKGKIHIYDFFDHNEKIIWQKVD